MVSRRNLAPPLLVAYLTGLIACLVLVGAVVSGPTAWVISAVACLPLVGYLLLIFRSGLRLAAKHHKPGLVLAFPFVVACTHLSYGVALTWGVIRSFLDGRALLTQRTQDA